jgi:Rab-GTPase-TBC domain
MDINGINQLIQGYPGYYRYITSINEASDSKSIKQIDRDIPRTFPHDLSFNRIELRRILVAYSVRNPNIGYCQGLNFLVATILSFGFTETEAFWMYVQIVEKHLPIEYYNSMSGIILHQKIFDYLFRAKLPNISKYLERIGVESCLFTVQWFICVFAFGFNRDIIAFIWDNIFFKGHDIIFQISLGIVWLLRKQILVQTDFVQCLTSIEQGCRAISDITQLKEAASKRKFKIPSNFISKLKSILEKEVIEDFSQKFSNVLPEDQLLASLNTSCIDDNECKQKILKTCGYFTYAACNISEIEGYLDLCTYPKHFECTSSINSSIYLFGRRNHCCRNDKIVQDANEEDAPIEFISKNSLLVNVKSSYAYISNLIDTEEFE